MGIPALDTLFVGKHSNVRKTYDRLIAAVQTFGPVNEAPKLTSIHLEKNTGFAGVHPRKSYFYLEFRTDYQIENPRIIRQHQLSAHRFEHTVKVEQESDVDDQLIKWLKDAYDQSK